MRKELIYHLILLDHDGCAGVGKQYPHFKPYWESVSALLGGEENLQHAIQTKPYLSDYFENKQERTTASENLIIEKVLQEATAILEALPYQKRNHITDLLKTLVEKPAISGLMKRFQIPTSYQHELIYRIMLFKIGSDCSLRSNGYCLEYIRKSVADLKVSFPNQKIVVILASISTRASSSSLDRRNNQAHGTGYMALQLPFWYLYGLKKVLPGDTCHFFPFMMSDALFDLNIGDSLFERADLKIEKRKLKQALRPLISDQRGSKIFTTGLLITLMSSMENASQVFCTLLDDDPRENSGSPTILQQVFKSVYNDPTVLPVGTTLSLVKYTNDSPLFTGYPQLQGQGHRETLLELYTGVLYHTARSLESPWLSSIPYLDNLFACQDKLAEDFQVNTQEVVVVSEAKYLEEKEKVYDSVHLKKNLIETDQKIWQSAQSLLSYKEMTGSAHLDIPHLMGLYALADSKNHPNKKILKKIHHYPDEKKNISRALGYLGFRLHPSEICLHRMQLYKKLNDPNSKLLSEAFDKGGLFYFLKEFELTLPERLTNDEKKSIKTVKTLLSTDFLDETSVEKLQSTVNEFKGFKELSKIHVHLSLRLSDIIKFNKRILSDKLLPKIKVPAEHTHIYDLKTHEHLARVLCYQPEKDILITLVSFEIRIFRFFKSLGIELTLIKKIGNSFSKVEIVFPDEAHQYQFLMTMHKSLLIQKIKDQENASLSSKIHILLNQLSPKKTLSTREILSLVESIQIGNLPKLVEAYHRLNTQGIPATISEPHGTLLQSCYHFLFMSAGKQVLFL